MTHRKSPHTTKLNRQSGFSFIEVLVSIVVLSIGLLSVAGLIGRSLAATTTASNRAEVIRVAMTIIDDIRSNPQAAWDGSYNVGFGVTPSGGSKAGTDLVAWKTALARVPGGDGQIAVANSRAVITARWNESITSIAPTQYVITFDF
jgi:type IV pilus assembly protein PilV